MFDIVCLSHVRWAPVRERPQHLVSRCSKTHRVFFVEEPEWTDGPLQVTSTFGGPRVEVLTPRIPHGTSTREAERAHSSLVERALLERELEGYVLWIDAPQAVRLAKVLRPSAVVYDCADDLTALTGASSEMAPKERELFSIADVVFTSSYGLYEAKCRRHPNVHAFPNGVDAAHFSRARRVRGTPADQARIPGPRLGFCGVVDDRIDPALLAGVCEARPHWHLVVIGPVAKTVVRDLPHLPNVHYLGPKPYAELPRYFSDWDVALLPLARSEATHSISPTITSEYLAAGLPVVSTSIRDVVRTHGDFGLCHIADATEDFVSACERALREKQSIERLRRVDAFLATLSWDDTWDGMEALIREAVRNRRVRAEKYPLAMTAVGAQIGDPTWAK